MRCLKQLHNKNFKYAFNSLSLLLWKGIYCLNINYDMNIFQWYTHWSLDVYAMRMHVICVVCVSTTLWNIHIHRKTTAHTKRIKTVQNDRQFVLSTFLSHSSSPIQVYLTDMAWVQFCTIDFGDWSNSTRHVDLSFFYAVFPCALSTE